MTEQQWRYHTPERDGYAPDDWDGSDWADKVWERALSAYHGHDAGDVEAAAVIRSICRSKEDDSLVEALENIVEYWNRDQNETAMADALWHIIATAKAALTSIERRS